MKPHQFQSITEEQWKSGLSRHKCALCSYDYGDPVHCESNWPLVIVIEDCYIPEWASEITKIVSTTPPETCYTVIYALAAYAEPQLKGQFLN